MFGLCLRVYNLSSENIYIDENYNIELVKNSTSGIINITSQDAHPPLYYLFFKYWTDIFGNTEFAIRIPSVIFSLFTLLFTYLLAKKMFNKKVASFSLFSLSIFMPDILFAQYARQYALVGLFSIISFYCLYLIVKENKKIYSLFFIISNILMIYTHLIGFAVIALEILLIYYYKKNKKFTIPFLIIFLFYIPWIKYAINQIDYMLKYFSYKYFSINITIFFTYISIIFFCFIISIMIKYDFVRKAKLLSENKNVFVFVSIMFIILYYVSLNILTTITLVRATIFLFPLIIIFFCKRVLSFKNGYVLLLLFLIVSIIGLFMLYNVNSNSNWRSTSKYLEKEVKEDTVIFDKGIGYNMFSYYSNKSISYITTNEKLYNGTIIVIPKEEIYEKINDSVWLVTWRNWRTKEYYKNVLDEKYTLQFEKNFSDINIYKYKKGE